MNARDIDQKYISLQSYDRSLGTDPAIYAPRGILIY
jgi:hypothetical protein